MTSKIEQNWKILQWAVWMSGIWQASVWVSELVEEWMNHGVYRGQTLSRSILKKAGNQLNGIIVCLAKDFVEWVGLDLRKCVLHVVRIHCSNLITGWGSKNLDNLHQLIDARFSWEQWLPKH